MNRLNFTSEDSRAFYNLQTAVFKQEGKNEDGIEQFPTSKFKMGVVGFEIWSLFNFPRKTKQQLSNFKFQF